MKKSSLLIVLLLLVVNSLVAAGPEVYPTHWWAGMKTRKIQLMVYEPSKDKTLAVNNLQVKSSSAEVKVIKVHKVENNRYLFIDIEIAATAKAQRINFSVSGNGLTDLKIPFEIKARRSGRGSAFAQGVNSSDLIYLIMPDRFSNGDPSNDKIAGMRDQSLNRNEIYDRHGGDLKGVADRLDYLKDLGVTTVWMTPVIENDMPNRTEHGYAFTNHYKIDPRLGGGEAYKKLSDELHRRGMKLIQDAVYNHVGVYHFTVQDPPMKDWLHQWPSYTQTNYKDQALFDKYASKRDYDIMADGWFTQQMPDMNQDNPYNANYMIQHAIWSVEEFGVDGWRIDTYAYNDLNFMNRCNKALMDEYPSISMFGETWVHGVPNQSYFCENNYNIPFKSNLQATTDFQTLFYGIQETLTKPFGWTDGVNKLYTTAAQDFVYKNPMRQVIFLDNHDLARFYSVVNEDLAKYKVAFAWLMTFRGIPQMYYGNEILMTGFTNPDGNVRLDFKGGWPADTENKFTQQGRTAKENEMFNYIRTFAQFRQKSSAIKTGKMMHFTPDNGVYVYFRYDNNQTVMCVLNQNDTSATIDLSRFKERMNGFTKAYDIATGTEFNVESKLSLGGKYLLAMELRK